MDSLSFDIERSKAILIGVSEFESFPKIAPAINNIDDIEALLINEGVLGLRKENVLKITNLRHDHIYDALSTFFADESNIDIETLFLYYVGHGFRETKTKELYLTGINSKKSSIRVSAIAFSDIKDLIESSNIQKRILLIDACYSGLATMGIEADKFTEEELDVKGTYVLTSSAGEEKSLFDTSERNTFFTAELLKVMKKGLPLPQAYLSLDNVFEQLQRNLLQARLPRPQRKTNLNATDFYLFHNPSFDRQKFIESEGDELFNDHQYEQAKLKYFEANYYKATAELQKKIERCDERNKIKRALEKELETKKKLQAEAKEKLEEEQKLKIREGEEAAFNAEEELRLKNAKVPSAATPSDRYQPEAWKTALAQYLLCMLVSLVTYFVVIAFQ